MVIAFPLAAWVYGGRATSRFPCGGVGGPGSEALPKTKTSRSASAPGTTLTSVKRSDGKATVCGSAAHAPRDGVGLVSAMLAIGVGVGAGLGGALDGGLVGTRRRRTARGRARTRTQRARRTAGHHEQHDQAKRTTDRDDQAVLRGLGNAWSYASISVEPSPSGEQLTALGDPCRCDAHPFRFVSRARRTGRRQERRIGLDQQPRSGHDRRSFAGRLLAAPEDEAREADREPEVDDRARVVERPRERVDDRGRPVPEGGRPRRTADTGVPELPEQGVLRVASSVAGATVQDGRLARVERQRQVAPQVGQLLGDRAEDAVVVEARLTDRNDPWVGRPGDDPRPAVAVDLGRVVRVDADRGVQPLEPIDAVERPARRRDVPARDEDPLDTGESGAAHNEVDVELEAISVEVAVAVDETHPGIVGPDASVGRPRPRRNRLGRRTRIREPRSRRRAAGRAAPDPRPGPSVGVDAPDELVEDRRAAVAVRAVRIGVPELGEESRRGRRQERRGRQPDQPADLDEVAEDVAQPRLRRRVAGLGGLRQDPRLLGVDRLVGRPDERPQARPAPRAGGKPSNRSRYEARVAAQRAASGESPAARGAGRSPSR